MTDEPLEFSISQYLDGTLDDAARMSLERCLSEDADARAMLETYRKLNVVLKSGAGLPDIQWESLARSISSAVDAAEAEREDQIAAPFRMPGWVRSVAIPMALAASIVVATGLGFRALQLRSHSGNKMVILTDPAPAPFASITLFGSQAQSSQGSGEVHVAIGPSADSKEDTIMVHYSGDVVSRPSHVAVASGVAPAHDTEAFSFDME